MGIEKKVENVAKALKEGKVPKGKCDKVDDAKLKENVSKMAKEATKDAGKAGNPIKMDNSDGTCSCKVKIAMPPAKKDADIQKAAEDMSKKKVSIPSTRRAATDASVNAGQTASEGEDDSSSSSASDS